MTDPIDPITSPARLAALHRAGLLDSPPDESFDSLARTAAEALEAPIALVSLVDEDRQFFKSAISADGSFLPEGETTLSLSLCRHAVAASAPLILPDACNDATYRTHPAIEGGQVAAYAGYPIMVDGHSIGTVCVIDTRPRQWGEAQLAKLGSLALDAATLIGRLTSKADANARRAAAKQGLGPPRDPSPGADSGIALLPGYLADLDRASAPPAPDSRDEAERALAAAAFFYLQQVDAYIHRLNEADDTEAERRRQDTLRNAVISAEAGLLRAVESLAQAPASDAVGQATPQAQAANNLRDGCAAFLQAEKRRNRTSLMFRRSLATVQELEEAAREASIAEQAMRLALRDFEMSQG